MSSRWRYWNRAIHRDLGFLCVGLTLVYVVSGVALNHIHDWNSNYRLERVSTRIQPWPDPAAFTEADVPAILAGLGEAGTPTGVFRPAPGAVQVFMGEGRVINVDLVTGQVVGEVVNRRPLLAWFNTLHLNRAGRTWTLVADLYAAGLGILAVTGLFILRGPKGISRRGAWLVVAGAALLLLALLP